MDDDDGVNRESKSRIKDDVGADGGHEILRLGIYEAALVVDVSRASLL